MDLGLVVAGEDRVELVPPTLLAAWSLVGQLLGQLPGQLLEYQLGQLLEQRPKEHWVHLVVALNLALLHSDHYHSHQVAHSRVHNLLP